MGLRSPSPDGPGRSKEALTVHSQGRPRDVCRCPSLVAEGIPGSSVQISRVGGLFLSKASRVWQTLGTVGGSRYEWMPFECATLPDVKPPVWHSDNDATMIIPGSVWWGYC